MKTELDITSEQLVSKAMNYYKLGHASPDLLLARVIADMRSNADPATVIRQAVTNSIAEAIRKMDRQALAAESEFQAIGQMSLLGDLIPEHKIPNDMQGKPAAEVDAWMQSRAEIEAKNLEELRVAVREQERKAERFSTWANATRQVCETLERAGLDPRVVTYAEAINKAEAV